MDGKGGKCAVRGTGACALREARQLAAIEAALGKRPMTVAELAPVIGVSPDTVRSRLRTLVACGRPVRVVDWLVLPTSAAFRGGLRGGWEESAGRGGRCVCGGSSCLFQAGGSG